MALLEKIKQYLHDRNLNKYQDTNIGHLKEDHFNRIDSIGIIFYARDMEDRERVLKYKEQLILNKKKVKVLGYFDIKMENASFPFDYFSAKDISFSYVPKSPEVKRFIEEPFDVLLNLDTSLQPPVEFIVAASSALFKVGPVTENVRLYDVMIEIHKNGGIQSLINEIQQTFSRIQ